MDKYFKPIAKALWLPKFFFNFNIFIIFIFLKFLFLIEHFIIEPSFKTTTSNTIDSTKRLTINGNIVDETSYVFKISQTTNYYMDFSSLWYLRNFVWKLGVVYKFNPSKSICLIFSSSIY